MAENGKEEKWVSSATEGQEENHANTEKLKLPNDEREDKNLNGEKEGKEETAEFEDENEDKRGSGYEDGPYNGANEEEENEQAGQIQEEEADDGDEVESKGNWRNHAVTRDEGDVNDDETGDGVDGDLETEVMDGRKKKSNFLENVKAFGEDEPETEPAKKKVKGSGNKECFE